MDSSRLGDIQREKPIIEPFICEHSILAPSRRLGNCTLCHRTFVYCKHCKEIFVPCDCKKHTLCFHHYLIYASCGKCETLIFWCPHCGLGFHYCLDNPHWLTFSAFPDGPFK